MIKKLSVLIVAVVLIMLGIGVVNEIKEGKGASSNILEGNLRDLELSYLRAAVDPSILEYANIEILGLENISTSTDDGKPYLALRIYPGQPKKNNGIRSEVSIDFPYKIGDTVRYSWEFKMPEGFKNDAPQNRWWVFADWHDQPDATKGETWDTYVAKSAPIIFGYGYLDGKDVLGFSYGTDTKPIGTIPFSRGKWHKVTMVVKWSQGDEGKAQVYFDDAKTAVFDVKGANMLNAFQHYLKIGQYHHPDISLDTTILLRNITIQKL